MRKYLEEKVQYLERLILLGAKQVLTMDDVVLLTGLKKSHLYRLTSSKEIPHYKPNGKCVYFNKKEIEEWCLQNRVKTIQEAEQEALAYTIKKGGLQ